MSDESVSRGADMSPQAIDRRLRDLGDLYELGRELAKLKYLGKVEDLRLTHESFSLDHRRPRRDPPG